jgi:tetratricopeptide (TPR) repeat protein
MSARAQMFGRLLWMLAAVCVVAFHTAALAQDRAGSITPAQVTQAIERVRSAPDNEDALRQALALGGTLLRDGRFADASELFAVLADYRPRHPEILYGAALATFNAGLAEQAEVFARKAVEAAQAAAQQATAVGGVPSAGREQVADALVLLGVVLAVRGDDAGALKSVKEAVQLAPNNFDAQLALGRALFGIGDDAGATVAFRAAVALRPTDAPALFYLATALEHGGDAVAALATYRELIARKPDNADGHLGLGVLLLKQGGVDEGLRELRRALEINPNLYEARITLGRTLVAQGHALESIEHLRHAAELAPNNPEPHYQLSIAYRRLGRKEEAAAESIIVKRIHETRRGDGSIQASSPAPPDK